MSSDDLLLKFPNIFEVPDRTPEEQAGIDADDAKRHRDEIASRRTTIWLDLLEQCGSRYHTASFASYEIRFEAQRAVATSKRIS